MKREGQPLYDDASLAAAYARVSASNVCNARYERPALRRIVGPVDGRDLLDAGCAAGEHAAWFANGGARVTALDASAEMVALTRVRLAGNGRVVHHDLRNPLPFEANSFDTIVSSLTLHYVADWKPVLAEFRRVLRPGGRVVVSTHHPIITLDAGPYFDVHAVDERWSGFADAPVPVHFFHRPVSAIVAAFLAAGFRLDGLHELRLIDDARPDDPPIAARLRSEPWFLAIEASRDANAPTDPANP